MNILITDELNFERHYQKNYAKVLLIGVASSNLEDLIGLESKYNNVIAIMPNENMDKAYVEIKKHLVNYCNGNLKLLGEILFSKELLFNLGILLLAIQNVIGSRQICLATQFNKDAKEFGLIDGLTNVKCLSSSSRRKSYLKSLLVASGVILKAIGLVIQGLFKHAESVDLVKIDYPVSRILGGTKYANSEKLLNHREYGFRLSSKSFLSICKSIIVRWHYAKNISVLRNAFHLQANSQLKLYSIIDSFSPKVILAVKDAHLDAINWSWVLNKENIKFGCYSHSCNYNFRLEYIYIPFDFYFVWSEYHLSQIKSGSLINSDCRFFIAGSPQYKGTNFTSLTAKSHEVKYDILVIGEYYYDKFCDQPFNSLATNRLAKVLSQFADNYAICIRPRFTNDGYLKDVQTILGDTVDYSIPNEQTETTTVLEDILSSRVIISVFSGAIHEALLLEKTVIQVNFQGIKSPKNLEEENLVYYAESEAELRDILVKALEGNISELDYKKHAAIHVNNGIFDEEKAKREVLNYLT